MFKLDEFNESPTFLDANLRVNNTWSYFSGDFSYTVSAGTSDTIVLQAAEDSGYTNWGSYKTGSATLQVYKDNTLVFYTSSLYVSGGASQYYNSNAITYASGSTYKITGSTRPYVEPTASLRSATYCYSCGQTSRYDLEAFDYTSGSYQGSPFGFQTYVLFVSASSTVGPVTEDTRLTYNVIYSQSPFEDQTKTISMVMLSGSSIANGFAIVGNTFINNIRTTFDGVTLETNSGTSFVLSTGSLNSGSYLPVDICSDTPNGATMKVNYTMVDRPDNISVYNNLNTLITSTGWVGVANYPGPWGSSLGNEPTDKFVSFVYNADQSPYYLSIQYGNANPSSSVEDTVYVSLACDTSTDKSTLPFGITGVTSSCNWQNPGVNDGTITVNITGGLAPYSISINNGATYPISTSNTSYTITGLGDTDFSVAVKDSNNITKFWPVTIYCSLRTLNVGFITIDGGTGSITYSGTTYTTPFTATGYVSQSLGFTASAAIGSTVKGWSEGGPTNFLTTNSTYNYQISTATTQSIYAVISSSIVVDSWCYYNYNPISASVCDTCNTTSSVYYNLNSYDSNSIDNITWYGNRALTTNTANGFYKLISSPVAKSPVYQLTNGTASFTGFCGGGDIISC